jgi:hypothetical protein
VTLEREGLSDIVQMTRAEVEAGLDDGSLVRGVATRYVRGTGDVPGCERSDGLRLGEGFVVPGPIGT